MTTDAELPRSHFALRDLVSEAVSGLVARPGRSSLTAAGTVLGIAALVTTLGLARTAGNQVVTRFDEVAETDVVIRPAGSHGPGATPLPWDAEERIRRLNGVRAAGTITNVAVVGTRTRSIPIGNRSDLGSSDVPIVALSPGAFAATRASLRAGREFDDALTGQRVAVLGPGAAAALGIGGITRQPAIFIGDDMFTVIGVLEDVERRTDLLNSVMIPDAIARQRFGLSGPGSVQIDTAVGAADLVGRQAPIALAPEAPEHLEVSVPVAPKLLKARVESDVNALFLALGGVSLLVGALGIANVTLVSVLERVPEIGIRRAFGATRLHVAGQFLLESTLLGGLGGVVGTSIGLLSVVAISASKGWVPVLYLSTAASAPCLGAVVGLLAGWYPALRASSIEPVEALRG